MFFSSGFAGVLMDQTYVCVCKLPNGLDLGGFVLKGAAIGLDRHDPKHIHAPDRERLFGYAITRNVPAAIWKRWYADNANGPIVQNGLVMGFPDVGEQLPIELQQFCVTHARVRGDRKAGQDGSMG